MPELLENHRPPPRLGINKEQSLIMRDDESDAALRRNERTKLD